MTAVASGARERGASSRCRNCAHFNADPLVLEAAISGLRSFGSAFAAVRDGDGLCARHGRYLSATASCAQFAGARSTPP